MVSAWRASPDREDDVPRAKQRTPELQERILDAAIGVLAADGAAAVTTRRVAAAAHTSAPAIYELFGAKSGLIRAVFFEGFRRLVSRFDTLAPPTGEPADLIVVLEAFRSFTQDNPRLFEVMYARPFEVYTPEPDERSLGDATRSVFVDRAKGCVAAKTLSGDPVDIAHAVLGLAVGLATQETAGWLGTNSNDCDRRWADASRALLDGYSG